MQSERTKAGKHPTGIEVRHARSCLARNGAKCSCKPTYQANVWSKRDGKRIRKTFPSLAAAKSWRHDALVAVGRGTMRAPTREMLREATDELVAGMKDGTIRNRNRRPFKPSAIRSYRQAIDNHVLPWFGPAARLSDITRNDVQDFVDHMLAEGFDPSTVRNALMPLRVIYRGAIRRGGASVNPTSDLDLPAVTGKRDRTADPAEATTLLAALPDSDRAVWATALYAGLRSGELEALRDQDVDLDEGVIRVVYGWDKVEGFIDPKSDAGKRIVPICAHLRGYLEARKPGGGFYFGTAARPFDYDALYSRAKNAWKDAGLERIGLHECRHSFSTFLDAAGVSETRADRYMGHSNPSVANRYRHPTQFAEDAAKLDDYLSGAEAGKIVPLAG
jgi:integrase